MDKTESITPGHAFSSRPSALKFYYNYVPKEYRHIQGLWELKMEKNLSVPEHLFLLLRMKAGQKQLLL